jgi:hypothetical protein
MRVEGKNWRSIARHVGYEVSDLGRVPLEGINGAR